MLHNTSMCFPLSLQLSLTVLKGPVVRANLVHFPFLEKIIKCNPGYIVECSLFTSFDDGQRRYVYFSSCCYSSNKSHATKQTRAHSLPRNSLFKLSFLCFKNTFAVEMAMLVLITAVMFLATIISFKIFESNSFNDMGLPSFLTF